MAEKKKLPITNPDPRKFVGRAEMFKSPCSRCKWLSPTDSTKCFAFQAGIPTEILSGKNDHTKPVEGDNGITYAPRGT